MESGPSCIACGNTGTTTGPRKGGWAYRRCRTCGLLTLDPLPTAQQVHDHYQPRFRRGNYEVARRYAEPYRRVHSDLADWIDLRPAARVLDVGCFTGELLAILADRGADVHGVEWQGDAVAIANERLGDRVRQGDIANVDLPAASFDAVTMMAVIEHVLEPKALIERTRELLKPGGRLYLETPNASSLAARVLRGAWPAVVPVEHIHLFTERALRLLLEHEGFEDVRARVHVKRLPVEFVHDQLANFGGPRWQTAFRPVARLLSGRVLPFYGGEMLISASVPTA
jgi:SAM-dependent methyltransferase